LHDHVFNRFDRLRLVIDRQTDRQTPDHSIHRLVYRRAVKTNYYLFRLNKFDKNILTDIVH